MPQVLSGVGGNSQRLQCQHIVQITRPDGQIGTVKPFVLSVSLVLWRRDVLTQWEFLCIQILIWGHWDTWHPQTLKTSDPVWVNQWSLPLDRLRILQELLQIHLEKGH